MWPRVALLLLAAGCYGPSYGNGELACGPGDACPDGLACAVDDRCYLLGEGPTPDDASADAAVGPCALELPFEAPVALPGVNSGGRDNDARLSPGMLAAIVSREVPGYGLQIMWTERESTEVAFGPLGGLDALNSTADDAYAAMPAHQLSVVFASNRTGGPGGMDLWSSSRLTTVAAFDMPIPIVSTAASEDMPYLAGSTLWFASNRVGAGAHDIYSTMWLGTDFGTAEPVLGVNTSAEETNPVLSGDVLTLYFKRDTEIVVATRPDLVTPFGPADPVGELNSPLYDAPLWLSADGCTIVISSERPGGAGGRDLYIASKPPR